MALALASLSLAVAERPPLPEDELIKGSDLIVEVDVLSVTKTGQRDAPVWLARLNIRQTLKGEPPPNPMEYWFLPPEPNFAGGRNDAVYAGQHLRLYLIRDNIFNFEPWASNGIELLENFDQERYVLPTGLGDVIYADGMPRLPDPLHQSLLFHDCLIKIDRSQATPHGCQSLHEARNRVAKRGDFSCCQHLFASYLQKAKRESLSETFAQRRQALLPRRLLRFRTDCVGDRHSCVR